MFAIGGTYILRYDTVKKMLKEGWLTDSPFRWLRIGEDVMLTSHVYAVGYKAYDDIINDGIFAICGKEPWIHPIELCQRGHYIIHTIKDGITKQKPYMSESELANFLIHLNLKLPLSTQITTTKGEM